MKKIGRIMQTIRWLVFGLAIFLCFGKPYQTVAANNPDPDTETPSSKPGQAATGEKETEQTNEIYESILEELDLEELEQEFRREGIEMPVSFSDMVKKQIEGDEKSVLSAFLETVSHAFFGTLAQNKSLLLELIGIVLIGSIFVNLSNSFASGLISENGFYITYMLMTSLLLTSFSMAYGITVSALEKVLVAVRLFVPAFLLVLQFLGHTAAAGGTYHLVLIGIWVIQAVIIRVVLPLIEFYVIVSMVNNLGKEDSFSKLCELVQSLIKWILKTIIAAVIGLNIIKGLLGPQMDILGKTMINRTLAAIPGSVVSVLAGTYLACGMIIKNSIGIAGIILLSVICLIPLVQLFLLMFTVRITTALIQPMGDRRYVDGTSALAGGIGMLMQALASALVLFVVTLAIMAGATNGSTG